MLSWFFDVYSEGFTEASFLLEGWPQAATIIAAMAIRAIRFMVIFR
jgi:hypothetical protein